MKKAKNIFFFVLLALTLNFFVADKIVLAELSAGGADRPLQDHGRAGSWTSQIGMPEIGAKFGEGDNPEDIRYKVVRVINLALTFLGIICVGLIVFAGFKWMLAAGNEDQIKSAQKILKNTVIGLLIILVSWSITIFIMLRLNSVSKGYDDYLDPTYIH